MVWCFDARRPSPHQSATVTVNNHVRRFGTSTRPSANYTYSFAKGPAALLRFHVISHPGKQREMWMAKRHTDTHDDSRLGSKILAGAATS